MLKRRDSDSDNGLPEFASDTVRIHHEDPESDARRLAYASNTRLKFERVYESARKAITAGDSATALLKCRAALDLLNERVIFGPNQESLRHTLEDWVRKLSGENA